MGLDTQLVDDGTYFVVEQDGALAGCGGWSRRATLYGGDRSPGRDAALLDPARDAAHVRAMYTHPAFARREHHPVRHGRSTALQARPERRQQGLDLGPQDVRERRSGHVLTPTPAVLLGAPIEINIAVRVFYSQAKVFLDSNVLKILGFRRRFPRQINELSD